ncbi:NAD-dependent succinate-semialdehyde dehydrogenase [Paraglaciecola polaris]|uniref:Succinate-semialdehyde dehydrogenase [NADP+] 1 n=1 Tax=Paraglaciecola polaris LMG 21857 TaxID=1129793 RepID=K7AHP9_9ALTE|nr:NAD-dependent succinate-semialdehyde dehydrogenase [Paraglaciecola polaris]GAC34760.1 succinate-semialdehyde dehydrogenase [NADP+] 1 [Paraglaciecola polaris LMG 21857]|tara:strand:- start:1945 stop:3321 length:1377 start_codon:yes stop_codon:yes gene_type:complete
MSNTVKTINPTTEEQLKEYTLLSKDEAIKAVDKADEVFQTWKFTDPEERAKLLNSMADVIDDNRDALVTLMIDEMGKVKEQGYQEVDLCAAICRYSAEKGPELLADEEREYEQGKALVSYRPLGVVLGIQPWNFPLYQVIRYSASNLMAGNVAVLKHAANVFGMAEKIQEMYETAGFPKGAYQSVLIDGETASELIKHEKVRGVSFTGSDGVGKKVGASAAENVKKSVLELGSNDAYVVLDDADLKVAVEACVMGRIVNNGETCVSAKRFIVTEKNYDGFKEAFVSAMKAIKMGDPNLDDTDLGPMAREDLRDKLHQQVSDSIKAGANCLIGGEVPERTGYFYPATVLENVQPGSPAYDDELFGPVASLIKAKNDQDAMRIANDSRYGLGGGIFSQDEDKAIKLAREVFDTGMININGYGLAHPNLPFGGVKDSGYGREHGGFGIREFVNVKAIMVTQ